jgi:hypothetical protein
MKKILIQLLPYITVLIFASCLVQPAFAHAGEPRLEISVERISPGGTLEVRGVDFDYEELVTLSLMNVNVEIPLHAVTTDVEGTFTQIVVLPADLSPGEYNFQAKTDHEAVTSPTLTVWGVAVEDQESNGIQDQSDVQLEPVPTSIVAVATVVSPAALPESNAPRRISFSPLIWIIAAGIGIIILAGFVFRLRR